MLKNYLKIFANKFLNEKLRDIIINKKYYDYSTLIYGVEQFYTEYLGIDESEFDSNLSDSLSEQLIVFLEDDFYRTRGKSYFMKFLSDKNVDLSIAIKALKINVDEEWLKSNSPTIDDYFYEIFDNKEKITKLITYVIFYAEI